MAKTGSSFVEERRLIAATADMVFTTLTSSADLVGWLANEARCEARVGGAYDLHWKTGYDVYGKVLEFKPPHRLTVSWRGSNEPGETTVAFKLTTKDSGVEVVVRHSGFGQGAKWAMVRDEALKGWARSLENLAYLLETGVDLREVRRPMMGVNVGEPLSAERSARLGLDVSAGIYLDGVIDGMSAQLAGLQAHDVLTSVGGQPVPDFAALVKALQGRAVGDRVAVEYMRGKEHKAVSLELRPRPMPDIPINPNVLLATLLERYDKVRTEVVKAVNSVSDEKAGRRPAEGEWSAKETIAHLCVSERDLHYWLGELLIGNEPMSTGNPSIVTEKLMAVLSAAPTVAALLHRFDDDQHDTLAIMAALRPEIIANKARYHRVGLMVYEWADHVHEHVAQIRAALAAA